MNSRPAHDEAPIQYTKDSFIGVRDAWLTFAAKRISRAAVALEQLADKLPDAVKSKIPLKTKAAAGNSAGHSASASG